MEAANRCMLETAIASLGPLPDDITLEELDARLIRRVTLITSAMREEGPAAVSLAAPPLIGIIKDVEYEERSNRDIVTIKVGYNPEETIRTPRLETAHGKMVAESAHANIGKACLIKKVLEPTKDSKLRVRIAYDIMPLRRGEA